MVFDVIKQRTEAGQFILSVLDSVNGGQRKIDDAVSATNWVSWSLESKSYLLCNRFNTASRGLKPVSGSLISGQGGKAVLSGTTRGSGENRYFKMYLKFEYKLHDQLQLANIIK